MAQREVLDYEGLVELVEKIDTKYGEGGINPKGTVATISALPTVANAELGDMYNITTGGETTADFVEGAGKTISDGANVYCVNVGTKQSPVHKWDVFAGTFNLKDRLQFGTNFPASPVNGQPFMFIGTTSYIYTAIRNPEGNPSEEGWYEYDSETGNYVLSEDTEVQVGTTYYKQEEEFVHGGIYEYSTAQTKWVPLSGLGDTIIPISKAKIDALFE